MAEGRMIRKRISQSKKLALCKNDSSRLLYFMMYPHADVEGRLEADTRLIKGQIIPLLGWSLKKIKSCLEDLNNVGLIVLYAIKDNDYLEFTRFGDFQVLRKEREARSHIPPIPKSTLEDYGSNAGIIPSKVKLSKDKLNEDKVNKDKGGSASACQGQSSPPQSLKEAYIQHMEKMDTPNDNL